MKETIDLSQIEPTDAFVVPGQSNCIDLVHPRTGRSCIAGETLEEIRLRYPNAIQVNLKEWSEQRCTEANPPVTWQDSTEERFEEMLSVLPPRRFIPGAFLVGEPVDHVSVGGHGRYECHVSRKGSFQVSSRPITVKEFNTLFL